MVEVTGGRFWAPYGGPADEMFRQRPPLDLTDKRLIALAKNLGPALMRVSGTWSNNTYLEAEGEHLAAIPAGYRQVLTRQQWRNVIAFSKAVDAPIVTSFAVSGGTRGADGVWTTQQAQRVVDLTREAGGTLYAAEFFNEPNMPSAAEGMPKGYSAANFAAEFRIFRDWARQAVPQMKIIGPGGALEGSMFKDASANDEQHPLLQGHISSNDMKTLNPGRSGWTAPCSTPIFTARCVTSTSRASRCGTPRQHRQLAADRPGHRPSSTASATSTRMPCWRRRACRCCCTTRLQPRTTR